ncbi:MAG TPA: hypothetical protein VFU37_19955 [Pyrinomonadaceae bacterium]|nr:hypothetical protein [Pyrinomonadaceae bacterium]
MKKQTKKLSIKVRDLKPVKDAKGGGRKHHHHHHPKVNTDNLTGAGLLNRTHGHMADFKEP